MPEPENEPLPKWEAREVPPVEPRAEREDILDLSQNTTIRVKQDSWGYASLTVFASSTSNVLPRDTTPERRRHAFLRFALAELEVTMPVLRALVAEIPE